MNQQSRYDRLFRLISDIGVNFAGRNKDSFPLKLPYRMLLLLILLLVSLNDVKSQETHDLVYACQSLICDPPKMCIIRDEVAQCLLVLAPAKGTTTYLFGRAEITPEPRKPPASSSRPLFTKEKASPETFFSNLGAGSAPFDFKLSTSTASTTTSLSPLAPFLNLFGSAASITLPTLAPPSISSTPKPTDVCSLPPLTGTCNRARIMWYFDTETGKCERFSYSGCGNENRFPSRIQCETKCFRQG